MIPRKAWAALAAASLLTSASLLRADPAPSTQLKLDAPHYLADQPAPERKPLMDLLNAGGMAQPLEDLGINLFGHVEGSYTWNFDRPKNDLNFGRVFDFEHDEPLLNQVDLTIERPVDLTKNQFDIGGRVEWIFGADAGLIHSNGLFDWYDSPRDPENQFDLNQAYIDLALPVGNGLRLRGGKIVTLMGWETINPTTNALYSHSYLFGFAIPFTHTGLMATYQLNDNWLVEGGIFRGWEQSVDDNNGTISYHFKLGYTSTDKKLGLINQFVTGPERTDEDGDYRTVYDLQVSYALSDTTTLGLNGDYGWEANAAPDGSDAQWYGIAGYLGHKLNDSLTFNTRAEWFRDNDATRIGVAGNFYELTVGLTIRPFPKDRYGKNLLLRPELRGDWATEDVFDAGSDDSQYTAALDVLFLF